MSDASGRNESRADVRVNGGRLWQSLMELATIGATAKGGVCRLALTDLDRQGRDRVVGGSAQPVAGGKRPDERMRIEE